MFVEPALAVAIELRWARQEQGLSQAELARRAGVSQQQIAKLERPGENPSIETLTKVARALGLQAEVRFTRPPDTGGFARWAVTWRRRWPLGASCP